VYEEVGIELFESLRQALWISSFGKEAGPPDGVNKRIETWQLLDPLAMYGVGVEM
jgi:hypothetical protein